MKTAKGAKKIRVVVVDDSAYNRRTITRMLEEVPEVEVVGYAADGEEGIRKVIELRPDLVTLDLEMPKMDGFTLLRIIMANCPTAVIVISSQSEGDRVFKALELGALDFIAKPTSRISEELLKIQHDLQEKVRSVFNLNLTLIGRSAPATAERPLPAAAPLHQRPALPRSIGRKSTPATPADGRPELVVIGSSTGGPPALQHIFSALTSREPFAVVVAQHMPEGFTRPFAERLNRFCAFDIREASDGDPVRPGEILIAPGGKNTILERRGEQLLVRVVPPRESDKYVPSVDALFESAADVVGKGTLGLVLTGMGNDGSRGVRAIKRAGGMVLAEDKETAVVFGMPREAIATGVVDRVLPLPLVAREILLRCGVISERD